MLAKKLTDIIESDLSEEDKYREKIKLVSDIENATHAPQLAMASNSRRKLMSQFGDIVSEYGRRLAKNISAHIDPLLVYGVEKGIKIDSVTLSDELWKKMKLGHDESVQVCTVIGYVDVKKAGVKKPEKKKTKISQFFQNIRKLKKVLTPGKECEII